MSSQYASIIAAETIYEKHRDTTKDLHDAHVSLIAAEQRVLAIAAKLERAKEAVQVASALMDKKRKAACAAESYFKANIGDEPDYIPPSPDYSPTSPNCNPMVVMEKRLKW